MYQPYQDDLAYIHDTGYGHLAKHSTPLLIQELANAGFKNGTVVELGCGSGITSRMLCDTGYDVIGVDISEALIEMARERVPEGEFHVGSFVDTDVPPCIAVTAIGEVFNHHIETETTADTSIRAQIFQRIYNALEPGGIVLFDMDGPARAPSPGCHQKFGKGPDWVVLIEEELEALHSILTRRITSFRKFGDVYRRDDETHRLQLAPPEIVVDQLQRTGFEASRMNHYGELRLPQGLTGFLAKKPHTI